MSPLKQPRLNGVSSPLIFTGWRMVSPRFIPCLCRLGGCGPLVFADRFVLGGTSAGYPGYGCLPQNNHVMHTDFTLGQCRAACVADAHCRSIDFYVGRSGHSCTLSTSVFADVGRTTSTTSCRYFELTRSGAITISYTRLINAFELVVFDGTDAPTSAPSTAAP